MSERTVQQIKEMLERNPSLKLTEILHIMSDDREKGLINIDDWKMTEADHLKTMGFEFDGDYHMSLKNPQLRVYKKKFPQGECFVVEGDDKPAKAFPEFDQLVKYFDSYSQPEIDKEKS